ncbi:uncharacterized protein LOC130744971 [Lotus japonicus]|uniref:uncharacterized protein LOC130744971 n=1 Tax=Lotus japonicus TaxID=34305 RepID=UPI002588A3BE|nr:uncharacterized protein LOC130744971 [Lotus japonicus]
MNFLDYAILLLMTFNVLAPVVAAELGHECLGVIIFMGSLLGTVILSLAAKRQESRQLQSERSQIARIATRALPHTKKFQQGDIEIGSQCDRCAICVEQFKNGEQIQPFGVCVHVFHSSCLNSWLLTGKTTCPVCRQGLKIDIC